MCTSVSFSLRVLNQGVELCELHWSKFQGTVSFCYHCFHFYSIFIKLFGGSLKCLFIRKNYKTWCLSHYSGLRIYIHDSEIHAYFVKKGIFQYLFFLILMYTLMNHFLYIRSLLNLTCNADISLQFYIPTYMFYN